MAQKRRKKPGSSKGFSVKKLMPKSKSLVDFLKVGAAGLAGAGVGIHLGRPSLFAGLGLGVLAAHLKDDNPWRVPALAASMTMALTGVKDTGTVAGTDGMDGFDLKQRIEQGNERVKTYLSLLKDKLYLPKKQEATVNGLGNPPTYFVNPFGNTPEIDLTPLDRISDHIAAMNGTEQEEENEDWQEEIEREF